MKGAISGVLVSVLAGSVAIGNTNGKAEAAVGQVAMLAASQAPLLVARPQDDAEALLRRIEELSDRIARLEEEIARLESRNAALRRQVNANAGGAVFSGQGGLNPKVVTLTNGNAGGVTIIVGEDENGGMRKVEKIERKE